MTRPYVVYVDDNFHYMDEDERYEAARFATLEDAVAYCQNRVRDDLTHLATEAESPRDLIARYHGFGEDPWVSGPRDTPGVPFSAWDYADEIAADVFSSTRRKHSTDKGTADDAG